MSIESELRRLIERIQPNLRPYMRFSLTGTVVAVYDDQYAVDIEIDKDVSLPKVPVGSLWAKSENGQGWGLWALPEIGSEVSVSFREGDVTRPYVDAQLWPSGKSPVGYTVGMFVIRDRHGQRFEFQPDLGVVDIKVDNYRVVAGGNHTTTVLGNKTDSISGNESITVGKNRRQHIQGSQIDTVDGDIHQTVSGAMRQGLGKLIQEVEGDFRQQIDGAVQRQVSSYFKSTILGPQLEAVTQHWQKVIGGHVDISIANADDNDLALAIAALTGDLHLQTMQGDIAISTPAGTVFVGADDASLSAARESDPVTSDSSTDSAFFTWLTGLTTALNSVVIPAMTGGPLATVQAFLAANPVPSKLDGKITEGSATVKVAD